MRQTLLGNSLEGNVRCLKILRMFIQEYGNGLYIFM